MFSVTKNSTYIKLMYARLNNIVAVFFMLFSKILTKYTPPHEMCVSYFFVELGILYI